MAGNPNYMVAADSVPITSPSGSTFVGQLHVTGPPSSPSDFWWTHQHGNPSRAQLRQPSELTVMWWVSIILAGGGYAGQYTSGLTLGGVHMQSPARFWWGQQQGGVSGAIAYYLAHF